MTKSNPKLQKAARALERQGRAGDTLLAHINPWEAALLKALGGAGTRNPATGLLEFKYGADTKEGGAHGGGVGVGNRGGGAGSANAAMGLMGARTTATRNAGYGRGFDASGLTGDGSAPLSELQAQTRAAYNRAKADYNNEGNTGLDAIGNAIAAALGFGEIDPATQGYGHFAPDPVTGAPHAPKADWGVDVGGWAAGLAGLALRAPLGAAYALSKRAGLLDPGFGVVNVGPSVLGGSSNGGLTGSSGIGAGQAGGYGGPGNALDRLYRNRLAAQGLLNRPPAGGLLTPSTVPVRSPWPQPAAGSGALAPYSAMTRFGLGQLGSLPWGTALERR
ncbi:MAG: hypothetical protein ACOY3L_03685 [Pseudomonadota bacterium]